MTPNDLIAGGHRMARQLLHRMVDDLSPAEFRHQPVPGANSAAWVVGHLALTARRADLVVDMGGAEIVGARLHGAEAVEPVRVGPGPAEPLEEVVPRAGR